MTIKPAIEDHQRGDYWNGASVYYEDETEDGLVGIVLTGAKIVAEFKPTKNGPAAFTYSTEDGTITVPNDINWRCDFKKGIINHPANTYYFEVQVTFPPQNGEDPVIETILKSTWTILSDITESTE